MHVAHPQRPPPTLQGLKGPLYWCCRPCAKYRYKYGLRSCSAPRGRSGRRHRRERVSRGEDEASFPEPFFLLDSIHQRPFHFNNTRHPRAEGLHCTLFNTATALDTVQNEALLLTKDLHTRSVLEIYCTCKKRSSVALANPVTGQGSCLAADVVTKATASDAP